MAAEKPPSEALAQARPEVGDALLVIHDFHARSSDELSLAKGDRVELIERDDEFGDGWFLGRHLANGNSGLFPEVYTRVAPRNVNAVVNSPSSSDVAAPKPLDLTQDQASQKQDAAASKHLSEESAPSPAPMASDTVSQPAAPVTLPLNSTKKEDVPSQGGSTTTSSVHGPISATNGQDSRVLHETLNVIDEHITDLRSPPSIGALRAPATDSGSEYSSQLDHRLSYIQGEETDEEEDATHSRPEVESWSPDQVAEYLFTVGVEKEHCEVFRDQEITGEVLLGMDQSSLFIKAFDLGSVGRRLKTWQKIKNLQDECNNEGTSTRRTTLTYGSEAGSEDARRTRSRTSTLNSSIQRLPAVDGRPISVQTKRRSGTMTPRMEPAPLASPASPSALADSPTRPTHTHRPSAASVRDLHHSRRHSSTDFRLAGATPTTPLTPKLGTSGAFPQQADTGHKKQPSFDRNWTLGSAYTQRPLSSAGFNDIMQQHSADNQDATPDLDRGYFSGNEADGRRRNVLRKRDSGAHSRQGSYADEQRVRSATAISRHSRYGSVDSREGMPSSAAQKYYGIPGTAHKRTNSTSTAQSIRRVPSAKDTNSQVVTKLDGSRESTATSSSSVARPGFSADWLVGLVNKPTVKIGGLRATSDTVAGGDRLKISSPADSSQKDSPLQSPARTQSSTPSVGPSFEMESPDTAKSPSTAATASSKPSRKKGKKETSAYQRGLQKISPQDAMRDADYSGWMKKKSSNLMTTWKPRLFVLKGRRLAYYYSEDDDQEKGLIDISFHRVLPADNEKLTGLHATLTGAGLGTGPSTSTTQTAPADGPLAKGDDSMFIFKLVPPRAGLSRAVTFTKPTVHYFAVSNLQQGRLWMAALVKATIDRDDATPITTTYQQKTISLTKARAMRHRPPALMNLDESPEEEKKEPPAKDEIKEGNLLGIHFGETDSGVSGLEKLGMPQAASAGAHKPDADPDKGETLPPQSA